MIFYEPDVTKYPQEFKKQARVNPGLEALTGTDFVITTLPLLINQLTLQKHIDKHALFVQLKIGYDILSFDALHNFCARIQKCQIPKQQAILLQVGSYWKDENNYFRVKGKQKQGFTTWQQYRKMLMVNMTRGITVFPEQLESIDDLLGWIEDYQSALEKIEKEPNKEIYPPKQKLIFQPDDIWQLVEEVPKESWEYLLCSGLDGMGQKTVQAVREYFHNELLVPPTGHQVLKVLTDQDENGKALHKISGWGDKRRKTLRNILFLPDGFNLEVIEKGIDKPYQKGWQVALETFKELVENGHNAQDAFNACVKLSREVIEF